MPSFSAWTLGRGGGCIRSLGCPADFQYRRLIHPGGCIIPNPRPSEKDQTPKLSEVPPRRAVVLKSKAEGSPHSLSSKGTPTPTEPVERSNPGLAEMWLLSIGLGKMDKRLSGVHFHMSPAPTYPRGLAPSIIISFYLQSLPPSPIA